MLKAKVVEVNSKPSSVNTGIQRIFELAHEKCRAHSLAHVTLKDGVKFFMRFSASGLLGLKSVESTIYIVPISAYNSDELNTDMVIHTGPGMVNDSFITMMEGVGTYTMYLSDQMFESNLAARDAMVDSLIGFDLNEPLEFEESAIPCWAESEQEPPLFSGTVHAALVSVFPGGATISHQDFQLAV